MHLHGLIQTATLAEFPAGSDHVEMVLKVQGVGAGQPRKIIIPFGLLLQDPSLEPETVERRAFEAEVDEAEGGRWVVSRIEFASRVLRPPES